MTHEDYVSFEQAQRLKELGFDWKVRACYRWKLILDDDNPHYTKPKFVHNDTMRKRWTSNYNDNRAGGGSGKHYLSAPTLAQVQKWLREVKNMIVQPIYDYFYEKWYLNIGRALKHYISTTKAEYTTYEQALSAGIDKALEILKEQSNG